MTKSSLTLFGEPLAIVREEFRSCRSSGVAEWAFGFLTSGAATALSEKILGHILSIRSVFTIHLYGRFLLHS